MYITTSNMRGLQASSFVTQWYKKHVHPIYFYTNLHVLIPTVTFYDVKTPIAAKPSGISPNHTCQCSLVILSYTFLLQTTYNE